ncbi:hypothetical protein GGR57DRAFT_518168 [Xylariaceae sp. FL1272]|nr:hypothetical protein GGR57DRAFT_518168 [Xylariaceae sp. FL1272]
MVDGNNVSFPGDDRFNLVTDRWTTYKPPTFSATISQAGYVREAPFLATGARHGYTTSHGNLDNGLAIDLTLLNTVSVNKEAGELTVGASTIWQDILDPVFEAGFSIPTGSCSCTGMVGATLGGGVGRFNGMDGMIIDFLVSARLVTATGEVAEVSETKNPELFWGLRGAGANFGIVTSATYNLVPLRNGGKVTNVDMLVQADMAEDYFIALQSYNASTPAKLAGASVISYNAEADAPQILANWVYYGPEDECLEALAPILKLNPPVSMTSVVPWNMLLATVGFGIDPLLCVKNVIRNIHTANVRILNAQTWIATFDKMRKWYADHPTARHSIIEMETFPNQAASAAPDEFTAYPWRDAIGNMIFIFAYTNETEGVEELADKKGKEIRGDFVATSGYPELAVYVNYAHGDESLEQIYGAKKLPRLAALKKQWGPNNVFAHHNRPPTEYSVPRKHEEL